MRAQMDLGLQANSLLTFPIKKWRLVGLKNVSMNMDENTCSYPRHRYVRTEWALYLQNLKCISVI